MSLPANFFLHIQDKDRRLKQALAAKRSLLKKQAALAAEVASSPSRGLSASQSYSVLPTAGAASGEVAESTVSRLLPDPSLLVRLLVHVVHSLVALRRQVICH